MKNLLSIILFVFLPLFANAVTVEIDGIYYNIDRKNGVAEVTRSVNIVYADTIDIPEKVFYEGNEYLVTSIGVAAFFESRVVTVNFPQSITSIGASAFAYCHTLDSIAIPEKVTELAANLFADCEALRRVTLHDGVTVIGNSAFNCCFCLDSLDIPNTVESIEDWAFVQCKSLSYISIPTNLKRVGKGNFSECYALQSVLIPNLSSWCMIEFADMNANPLCQSGKLMINDKEITDLVIPDDVTYISSYAFAPCRNITSLVIGNQVTKIGTGAFRNCSSLTSVIIGEHVSMIDGWAFFGCSHLTSVTCYPRKVPQTGTQVFNNAIEDCNLYVPGSAANEYLKKEPWSQFYEIIKLDIPKHQLTYYVDDILYKSYTLEEGEYISPESVLEKEGYTFSGWSEIPETMPKHDVTVTGSFSVNKYKLLYKVEDEEYKSYQIEYGSSITAESAPTKEGYTFSGWSEIPKTMPAHDVIVTGGFSINSYTLTYLVDGKEYKSTSIVYGTTITAESALTKDGYTFSGWSEIPKTMPAHDVIVTGSFSINSYKLTYVVDSKEYKSATVAYGSTITAESAPTKEGYTFSGWSEIPKTMPAHDVTIFGNFTINSYTLTYLVDGKEYKSTSVVYGTTITTEATPTKEGYTFSGWSDVPKTMPAHDVTVTGTFIVNQYKLIYLVDGVEYKTCYVEYGTTIVPEEEPTMDDYIFSGWSEIPKTMPKHDVIINGYFTLVSKQLTHDGISYTLWEKLKTAEVSGIAPNGISGFDGQLIIPANIIDNETDYEVIGVANSAFNGCDSLVSISLPESVTYIGKDAFSGCMLQNIFTRNANIQLEENAFSQATYNHAMLYIPTGKWSEAVYSGSLWHFINIRETATETTELSTTRAFTLMDAETFGYVVYDVVNRRVKTLNSFYQLDESSPENSWQLVDMEGKYCLYNIGAKKFALLSPDGKMSLSETPVALDIANGKNGIAIGNKATVKLIFVVNDKISIDNSVLGIKPVMANESDAANSHYLTNGMRVSTPQKGVFMIQVKDGTARKIIKK